MSTSLAVFELWSMDPRRALPRGLGLLLSGQDTDLVLGRRIRCFGRGIKSVGYAHYHYYYSMTSGSGRVVVNSW